MNNETTSTLSPAVKLLLISACLLLMMSFGVRSSFGLFVKPISAANDWGRDVISIALALQNLTWGVVAVFAGGLADKYGNLRVIITAAIIYAIGVLLVAYADSAWQLSTTAGLMVGAGIAGTAFGIVLPALARAVPAEKRQWALGLGTAAGSMGQFILVPFSQTLIDTFGWFSSLHILALMSLTMVVLAIPLAPYSGANEVTTDTQDQGILEAIREAFSYKHYILLIIGFFVCGFHLAFITVHMPAYLTDLGFSAKLGAWSLSIIGIANMIGSYMSGIWSAKLPKQKLLSWIYFLRAIVIMVFITMTPSTFSVVFFSIGIGLLWLATIPPTTGLIAGMFGTRYMALLYGIVFLSHQIGSFAGAYLGGYLYEQSNAFQVISTFCGQYLGFATYGDAARYDLIWLINIALGLIAALIHWPIQEKPVGRYALNS